MDNLFLIFCCLEVLPHALLHNLASCMHFVVYKSHYYRNFNYPKYIENGHLLVLLKGEAGLPGPKGAKGTPGDLVSKSKNTVSP